MSEQINNGGSAFPVQDAASWQAHGMTLRDYFAAKAMQSLILNFGRVAMQAGHKVSRDETATVAYGYAKAMLAARGDA